MKFSDALPTINFVAISIISGAFWWTIRNFKKWFVVEVSAIVQKQIEPIKAEVKYDNGHSLKDEVKKINEKLDQAKEAIGQVNQSNMILGHLQRLEEKIVSSNTQKVAPA